MPVRQRHPARPRPEELLEAVGATYQIPTENLFDRSHQGAFRAVVYTLRRVANLPLQEVAAMAGISAPRVSQIQQWVERKASDGVLRYLFKHYKELTLED